MSVKVQAVSDPSHLLSRCFEKGERHQAHCHIEGRIEEQIRALTESRFGYPEGKRRELTAAAYIEWLHKGEFKQILSDGEKRLLQQIQKASFQGAIKGAAIGAGTGAAVGGATGGLVGFFVGAPVAGGGAAVSTPVGIALGGLVGALFGGSVGLAVGIAFTELRTIVKLVEKSSDFKSWIEKIRADHLFDHLVHHVFTQGNASRYFKDEKILDCPLKDRRDRNYHKAEVEKNWSRAEISDIWIIDHLPDFETSEAVHRLFLDWIQVKIDLVQELGIGDEEVEEFRKNLFACKQMILESYRLSIRELVKFSSGVIHHLQARLDFAAYPSLSNPYDSELHGNLKEALKIAKRRERHAKIEGDLRQLALQLDEGGDGGIFMQAVYAALQPWDLDPVFRGDMLRWMRNNLERLDFVALPLNDEESTEEKSL